MRTQGKSTLSVVVCSWWQLTLQVAKLKLPAKVILGNTIGRSALLTLQPPIAAFGHALPLMILLLKADLYAC